jgi:L-ascorbate metabolism protein UlaG (beta-lactamase superfamily)
VRQAVCPLGVGEYLEYWGYDPSIVHETDWGEELELKNEQFKITCLPSRHFSNRFLGKRDQTLWAAFLVDDGARNVYIGGDGGYDERFRQIGKQRPISLAVMENGQYNPNWANVHLLPEDLEQAILDLHPEAVITVHHDKFSLSTHAWSEPDSVARSIAERQGIKLLDQTIGSVVYF